MTHREIAAAGLFAFGVLIVLAVAVVRGTFDRHRGKHIPRSEPNGNWVRDWEMGNDYSEHLDGVGWFDAPPPPRRHRCTPQTRGWIGLTYVERCACGAIRPSACEPWTERNQRNTVSRLHAAAMVLGEYAARVRERLAATFRDVAEDEPECICIESSYQDLPKLLVPGCPVHGWDDKVADDDQSRPGGSPPSGPGPSTDLEQEPTEAEELAFLQAIRDDDPPRVMAAAKVQGTWLPLTGEPRVNPWAPPAFTKEREPSWTFSRSASTQASQHETRPGSPRPSADSTWTTCASEQPTCSSLPISVAVMAAARGQSPETSRPGFWPVPLAWGQEDVRRTMARDHDDTDIISQPRIVARRDIATRPYGFEHMLRSAPLRQLEAGVW